MQKKYFKIVSIVLLLCLVYFLCCILIPRKFEAPKMQYIAGAKYWNLPTGSRISYTFIPAKGIKKPYPIIYLEGGPGGAYGQGNIASLSPLTEDGYDVYLYDQIGSGRSARLENIKEYTAERHKKDLEEIIKKTGSEKVILIGQSWGAILAVFFAADNASLIDRIIFTGPGPIYPYHGSLAKIQAPDSLHLRDPYLTNAQGNEKAKNLRSMAIKFFARKFGWKLASDKEADNFLDYTGTFVGRSTLCDTSKHAEPSGGNGFYVQEMTMQTLNQMPDPRPKLKNSRIPVLIMKGQCDNQKWGFVTEYLELFPDHQLTIIPNSGHAISFEQPELYLKTIRNFLSK